jgi:hypothetical protein
MVSTYQVSPIHSVRTDRIRLRALTLGENREPAYTGRGWFTQRTRYDPSRPFAHDSPWTWSQPSDLPLGGPVRVLA